MKDKKIKPIKAWAVFNQRNMILWGTIQPHKKHSIERFEVAYSGRTGSFKDYGYRYGYRVRRITITVED